MTWTGGRVGQDRARLQRVRVDGAVTFTTDEFDAAGLRPLLGVPGGLAVETPDGIAVWDASTSAVGHILGPGPVTAVSSDGRDLAWCESTCADIHVAALDRRGPATARHASPGSQHLALSPDGRHLAALRPAASRAALVVRDRSTGEESIVAGELNELGALQWTDDGGQLFDMENSYRLAAMRIGRYQAADGAWELTSIGVGDGLAAIVVNRGEAASFFSDKLVSPDECRGANGTYPSGRRGVCTFAFPSPVRSESADRCIAGGEAAVTVPDAIGERLRSAVATMRAAGLKVVADGVPDGDPTGDDATVRAQEPPPGSQVPLGACIGFRTED